MAVKNKKEYLQLCFLPYISINEDIKYENILFWSFDKNKENYISDITIKDHISKLFKRYFKKFEEEPLENITIVSYKSPDNFKPLSSKQLDYIYDAVAVLSFTTVINNKKFLAFPSDNFSLKIQNFVPGNYGISISYGNVIREIDGGYDLERIKFYTPFHIILNSFMNYNKQLFNSIKKLKRIKNERELYRKIITSLQWVSYAYTNVENFSPFSRIVMMSTAFEILLDGFKDRWKFINKISYYTGEKEDSNKDNREIRNIYYKRLDIIPKEYSFKEWWAYEFYCLRNNIVHGKEVKYSELNNRKNEDYFLLAIMFFTECLKRILYGKKCYKYDIPDKILWAGINEKL